MPLRPNPNPEDEEVLRECCRGLGREASPIAAYRIALVAQAKREAEREYSAERIQQDLWYQAEIEKARTEGRREQREKLQASEAK